MATDRNAGTSVISGASSDRKITSSRSKMNSADRSSTWFPVVPDLACWSTLMAMSPARCTCSPGGGPGRAIVARKSLTSVVSLVSSPPPGQKRTVVALSDAVKRRQVVWHGERRDQPGRDDDPAEFDGERADSPEDGVDAHSVSLQKSPAS